MALRRRGGPGAQQRHSRYGGKFADGVSRPPRRPSPLDFDLFLFIPSGQRSAGTPRGCGSPLMALLPCALRFVLGTALIYGSPGSARVRPRRPSTTTGKGSPWPRVALSRRRRCKERARPRAARCRPLSSRRLGLGPWRCPEGSGGGSGRGRAEPLCAALGAVTAHPPARHRPVWRSESQNPEPRVPQRSLPSPESDSRRKRLSARPESSDFITALIGATWMRRGVNLPPKCKHFICAKTKN